MNNEAEVYVYFYNDTSQRYTPIDEKWSWDEAYPWTHAVSFWESSGGRYDEGSTYRKIKLSELPKKVFTYLITKRLTEK